jgi:Domain of unknown function (DUF4376)
MPSNVYNNFWLADDARVYGSAKQLITTDADPDYVAWTGLGNTASPWPRDNAGNQTNAALQDAVAPHGLFADLTFYAADARYRKASGGVSIGGKPYLSDPVSRNTVASAHDYAVANPGHITDWKLADGTFIQLDEAGLAHVLQEMATFVQACFTCESTTVAGISGGSITTRAQVDAAFAAISNVLP